MKQFNEERNNLYKNQRFKFCYTSFPSFIPFISFYFLFFSKSGFAFPHYTIGTFVQIAITDRSLVNIFYLA